MNTTKLMTVNNHAFNVSPVTLTLNYSSHQFISKHVQQFTQLNLHFNTYIHTTNIHSHIIQTYQFISLDTTKQQPTIAGIRKQTDKLTRNITHVLSSSSSEHNSSLGEIVLTCETESVILPLQQLCDQCILNTICYFMLRLLYDFSHYFNCF